MILLRITAAIPWEIFGLSLQATKWQSVIKYLTFSGPAEAKNSSFPEVTCVCTYLPNRLWHHCQAVRMEHLMKSSSCVHTYSVFLILSDDDIGLL